MDWWAFLFLFWGNFILNLSMCSLSGKPPRTESKQATPTEMGWKMCIFFRTAGLGSGELKKYISKQRAGVCFRMGRLAGITPAVRMRSDTGYWRAPCCGTLFLLGGRNTALYHRITALASHVLWIRESTCEISFFSPLWYMAQMIPNGIPSLNCHC